MSKVKNLITPKEVANAFAIQLTYYIAERFCLPIKRVIKLYDEMHYWDILNDDNICLALAHDGVKQTVDNMEVEINDILSRP